MARHRRKFLIYSTLVIGLSACTGTDWPAAAPIQAQETPHAAADRLAATDPSSWVDPFTAADPAPSMDAAPFYREVGLASWYGDRHQGRLTASGQRFDMNKLTAAHRSLPLDTRARVTNIENGRSIEVTVNDRGPYVKGRSIDLSAKAAEALGMKKQGVALVRIEVLPDQTASSALD